MKKLILPRVGEIYQSHSEVREVVGINESNDRYPDVIFMIPEKNRNFSQWLPLWSEWVRKATVVNG